MNRRGQRKKQKKTNLHYFYAEMKSCKVRLKSFCKEDYPHLISWVDSAEMLMQFGGPQLVFPLTSDQLDDLVSDKRRIPFTVVDNDTGLAIGHCEVYLSGNTGKIGRILIGDKQKRGKGYGQALVQLLLHYCFNELNLDMAELNVFEWNLSAIKCYEKAGFSVIPDKTFERKINGKIWTAINMNLARANWKSPGSP